MNEKIDAFKKIFRVLLVVVTLTLVFWIGITLFEAYSVLYLKERITTDDIYMLALGAISPVAICIMILAILEWLEKIK